MLVHFNPAAVLHQGLELFGFLPSKLSPAMQSKRFHEHFLASPAAVAAMWNDLAVETNGADLRHLFWTLHFYVSYPYEKDMRSIFGVDPATARKWIRLFTAGLQALYPLKVHLPEPDDRVYFLTVDGTDFRIGEPTLFERTWFSHKYKKAAVKYEVALSLDGNIAWVNGPFRGSEHDVAIFRKGLLDLIPKGKLVIADLGYQGESDVVDTPNAMDDDGVKSFKKNMMARHETVNKRFKDFNILSQVFRHSNGDPILNHKPYFMAIAVITQYKIENGEPLFEVFTD